MSRSYPFLFLFYIDIGLLIVVTSDKLVQKAVLETVCYLVPSEEIAQCCVFLCCWLSSLETQASDFWVNLIDWKRLLKVILINLDCAMVSQTVVSVAKPILDVGTPHIRRKTDSSLSFVYIKWLKIDIHCWHKCFHSNAEYMHTCELN